MLSYVVSKNDSKRKQVIPVTTYFADHWKQFSRLVPVLMYPFSQILGFIIHISLSHPFFLDLHVIGLLVSILASCFLWLPLDWTSGASGFESLKSQV